MSIKRAKPVSRGRGKDSDSETGMGGSKSEPAVNWKEQVNAKPADAFTPYALGTTFQKGSLILHSKFGKGLVTNVEGQRIEVLFEEGAKKLGHATA